MLILYHTLNGEYLEGYSHAGVSLDVVVDTAVATAGFVVVNDVGADVVVAVDIVAADY